MTAVLFVLTWLVRGWAVTLLLAGVWCLLTFAAEFHRAGMRRLRDEKRRCEVAYWDAVYNSPSHHSNSS
ncbi:MAG: hypothetical protein H0V07_08685 [Propionibacteriales bacterium]|nr:hypothetical protein [Propionibacteriales bacterium]